MVFSDNFFSSALNKNVEIINLEHLSLWLKNIEDISDFNVEEIPFEELDKWYFDKDNSNLRHESGKFFSIEGLRVETDFDGSEQSWDQPIINQPEIGILGIISKIIDGNRYFLMQAKMEPGNINVLQLSPTLQATKSNFSQAHKGKVPLYLEYFIDNSKSKILVDQLQSEQGGRFLKKRNRNMIVEVADDIIVHDDFCWLTAYQLKQLIKIDNLINMDSRSVISCFPFVNEESFINNFLQSEESNNDIDLVSINSLVSKYCLHSFDEIISWITSEKVSYNLSVKSIPLNEVKDWEIGSSEISNITSNRFSVVAVKVTANSREVSSWTQPIVKDLNIGLIGFLTKIINNTEHYLVQAKVEPGNMDYIDLAPTVSCSNYSEIEHINRNVKFLELFLDTSKSKVKFDHLQSEEGGRFHFYQNRYMIVQVTDDIQFDVPKNYKWMTLGQIMELSKYGYFNIEARGLIACIDFLK